MITIQKNQTETEVHRMMQPVLLQVAKRRKRKRQKVVSEDYTANSSRGGGGGGCHGMLGYVPVKTSLFSNSRGWNVW